MLNLDKLEQLKTELEAASWRIERYLEEQEVSTINNDEVFKNTTYVQQRAKLTAYLFVLNHLESDIPLRISQRRGIKMIDEKQGVFVDIKLYAEKLDGLPVEEKIKLIKHDMPVPGWD